MFKEPCIDMTPAYFLYERVWGPHPRKRCPSQRMAKLPLRIKINIGG
nr:MAG TPA: hypothetical protein [Caudoviricetes sp.]